MTIETFVAYFLLLVLTIYVLTGVADFGAGFWEIFARGKTADEEKALIKGALAPIWEANHVWLIVVIVLLSGAFPAVVPVLSTALHIPILLLLIGITLRGAAFVFRSYGPKDQATFQARWGHVFSITSALTPMFLGITLGGAVWGRISVLPDGEVTTDFISDWLHQFPILIGVFTLAIGVFLSAVYLSCEAKGELRRVYRGRAILSAVVLGVIAFGVLLLSRSSAPVLYSRLVAHPWSWLLHLGTGALAVATIVCLFRDKVNAARVLAIGQVIGIMLGLGLAQFPFLITPDITIESAAASSEVLQTLVLVTGIGLVFLIPGFIYLYWVFKIRSIPSDLDHA